MKRHEDHRSLPHLYTLVLCVQTVMVIACFIRAVKGPTIADRIVAINMIGTQIIIMVGVTALQLARAI